MDGLLTSYRMTLEGTRGSILDARSSESSESVEDGFCYGVDYEGTVGLWKGSCLG